MTSQSECQPCTPWIATEGPHLCGRIPIYIASLAGSDREHNTPGSGRKINTAKKRQATNDKWSLYVRKHGAGRHGNVIGDALFPLEIVSVD